MPQSLAKVYVHIVFSTKHRYPFLAQEKIRNEMHAYLGGTCNELGCPVIIVGGAADHVHVRCVLSRITSISVFLCDLKRNSSKWIKTKGGILSKFAWQNGYRIFSVGQSGVERVRHYIAGQWEHHRKRSFQEEYRTSLEEFGVPYDERFVWD